MSESSLSTRVRRRPTRLLAVVAVVAALVGATLVAQPADAQSGGGDGGDRTVRIPYDLAAFGGVRFDPTTVPSPADWYMQQWIYDSLLRQNADGSYSPGLAKSATVVDPQTIETAAMARVPLGGTICIPGSTHT